MATTDHTPPTPQARCPKCDGEMREGQALQNTASYGVPDFPGSNDLTGQTFSFTGAPRMVKVLKCKECGHSRARSTSEGEE